jgi:phosphoglycolate phosphatase-like HAD superfamily hydrolase
VTPSGELVEILRRSSSLLLDFDGPVTRLLPDGAGPALADAAREPLRQGGIALPDQVARTTDHLAVLRFASTQGDALRQAIEAVCTAGEVAAARRSRATPGAHETLDALHAARRPVVIVSNNAQEAVATYLQRHGLEALVHAVVGRPAGRPELMKPHPALVMRALHLLNAGPDDAAMVGDSTTDIEVSRLVGMPSIGYAKSARRGVQLAKAGADAIITHMEALGEGVRSASSAA